MTPTLRQLEYLVALAESGQFVEAARRCAVSQPALSKQVREVEEMLGVTLFERTRPRVLVTPTGEEILRRARLVLAQSRDLVAAAHELAGKHMGTVRLGVIPTIAPYGLPGLLVKLRKVYPDVSFAIHELQTEVLVEQLRLGVIDLGLLAQPFDDLNLCGDDLIVEPFVFIAPSDHSLGVPGPIELHEIAGANLILMRDGHCLRDQAIEVCALAGTSPSTSVAAASVTTLVRMVESGLGATLLPASALSSEVRPGQGLVVRSFGKSPPGRTLTLQWRSSSPSKAWFQDLGKILQEHYIDLNGSMPELAGPQPQMLTV